jgi:adenylosuccinate lyase
VNEGKSTTLEKTLQKNLNEIREISLGRLLKYITQNLDRLDEPFLIESSTMLKGAKGFTETFEKNFGKFRKEQHIQYLNLATRGVILTEGNYFMVIDEGLTRVLRTFEKLARDIDLFSKGKTSEILDDVNRFKRNRSAMLSNPRGRDESN